MASNRNGVMDRPEPKHGSHDLIGGRTSFFRGALNIEGKETQ